MQKIIVIGSPGAGKSYFSKQISTLLNLPLFHLDNIYWRADKTHLDKDEFDAKLNEILSGEKWIIDGNYNRTIELRTSCADTVFFLDYPKEVCIEGVTGRIGKARTDMPWTEESPDPEFLAFVKNFCETSRPNIVGILNKYPDRKVYRFTQRKDAEAFIASCFPDEIAAISKTTGIRLLTEHHVSGDLVYALGDQYILKVSCAEGRLLREKTVNDFLKGKVPVSESAVYEIKNGAEFYLKTCLPGDDLIDAYGDDPVRLTELLADALKMYHAVDTAGCDIVNPDSVGNCFIHGDFCLPNILVKDGKISGFIDTEASGLGDPWMDYAWAIWSLEYNLKTKAYTPLLLEKLGIAFDEEKYAEYTAL